jgi:2'-5' RNA ligase
VPAERRHLTVAFFGEVGEVVRPELEKRLARAASRHDRHELRYEGSGRFGERVLWLGVSGQRAALIALGGSVAAAARRCKIDMDDRPYRPHLTLGYGKPGAKLRPMADQLSGVRASAWTATEIVLVRSFTGPDPRHEELARWPLRSPSMS